MRLRYHIDTGQAANKAKSLINKRYQGREVLGPPTFDALGNENIMVVVEDFGKYEKAGVCITREEYEREAVLEEPQKGPRRRFFILPRAIALSECGFYKNLQATLMPWATEKVEDPEPVGKVVMPKPAVRGRR